MVILKLAFRNLIGAGLRTWLNVFVLSLAFVAIIWMQGFINGINEQASVAMIDSEIGGGQLWHPQYDPFDPLTLEDAHGEVPAMAKKLISQDKAMSILILQGSIFPAGRFQSVLLKGIDPDQDVLNFPSHYLKGDMEYIPAVIGTRMARDTGLQLGDIVMVRWRDVNGTFDAREVQIVHIFSTTVQSIDAGQLWLPLETLQDLTEMPGEATMVVFTKELVSETFKSNWNFKSQDYLLKDVRELAQIKSVSASIFYVLLLFLAMLAIFDTQVLSIFRRRKEMGTMMAMGMTRFRLIRMFTLEGAIHGVLAALMGAVYGIPLLIYSFHKGWAMPEIMDQYGMAIGEKLYPLFSVTLVAGTTVLVLIIVTIVSYMPTRSIARLKPTDALRGKMT
jgi:putative ABC transport system permease protein